MNYRTKLCFFSSTVLLAAGTYACGHGITDDYASSGQLVVYLGGGAAMLSAGAACFAAGVWRDVRATKEKS